MFAIFTRVFKAAYTMSNDPRFEEAFSPQEEYLSDDRISRTMDEIQAIKDPQEKICKLIVLGMNACVKDHDTISKATTYPEEPIPYFAFY